MNEMKRENERNQEGPKASDPKIKENQINYNRGKRG
jgi:hypothetical protein